MKVTAKLPFSRLSARLRYGRCSVVGWFDAAVARDGPTAISCGCSATEGVDTNQIDQPSASPFGRGGPRCVMGGDGLLSFRRPIFSMIISTSSSTYTCQRSSPGRSEAGSRPSDGPKPRPQAGASWKGGSATVCRTRDHGAMHISLTAPQLYTIQINNSSSSPWARTAKR